jgi:hypothetical protein
MHLSEATGLNLDQGGRDVFDAGNTLESVMRTVPLLVRIGS